MDIELEMPTTWPRDLVARAAASRDLLVKYHQARQAIDRKAQEEVELRVNPPGNPHRSGYRALVETVSGLLASHRLVAYHCTRLSPSEIEHVQQNGLRVLSKALIRKRLEKGEADGLISKEDHDNLISNASISDNLENKCGKRTGYIWFCPNRSTLQKPGDVHRLFRSWGGEAIYCGLEDDARLGALLRSIGSACVVKCAIPVERVRPAFPPLAERFLSQFVLDQIQYPEPSAGFDLYIEQDLPGPGVVEILAYPNHSFLELTAYESWSTRYRIS